jgi:RNA polymerase sigma factor (sigma-70 family)
VSSPETTQSLDSLVTKYSRLIRSAVGRVAGPLSPSIADDIEQNVLIALWKAMPGEQIPRHPSSYLYRAAVRETVRALKDRREPREVEIGADRPDPNPAPDRLLESRELGLAIRTVLSDLSPERRRAVQAHLMGYDVKEIMAMQGWPYNKARNLIARGMADLRRGLRRRGVGG